MLYCVVFVSGLYPKFSRLSTMEVRSPFLCPPILDLLGHAQIVSIQYIYASILKSSNEAILLKQIMLKILPQWPITTPWTILKRIYIWFSIQDPLVSTESLFTSKVVIISLFYKVKMPNTGNYDDTNNLLEHLENFMWWNHSSILCFHEFVQATTPTPTLVHPLYPTSS